MMIFVFFFLFLPLLVKSIHGTIKSEHCYHIALAEERKYTYQITCQPKSCNVYFLNRPNYELFAALRTLAYGSCTYHNCLFGVRNMTRSDYKIDKTNFHLMIDNNNTIPIRYTFDHSSKLILNYGVLFTVTSIVLLAILGACLLLTFLLCYYRVGIVVNFLMKWYKKIRIAIFGDPEEYMRQLLSLEALEEAFKRADQYEEISESDLTKFNIRSWNTRIHMVKFFEFLFFPEFCSNNSIFFPRLRCGNDLLNTFFDDHWSKFEYMIVQFRGDPDYARKAQAMFRAVHLYADGADSRIPPIFVSHLEYKKFWNRIFKHYFGGYDRQKVKVFKQKIWKTVLSRKINFAYLFELNFEGLSELVGETIGRILHDDVFNIHYDGRVDVEGEIYNDGTDEEERFQRHLKNVYLKPLRLNRKHHAYREILLSHDYSYYRTFSIIERVNHFSSKQIEYFINLRSRFGTIPMSEKRPSEIMNCPLCNRRH